MNKKGFIFSIITVLLLVSLSMIATTSLKKFNENEKIIEQSILSSKLKYMENDVVTDYLGILNISLKNLTRDDTNNETILHFNSFGVLPRFGLAGNLSKFESYIENNLSKLINANISLENVIYNLTFPYYNTTFVLQERDDLDIYTDDLSKFKSINLSININQNISRDHCPADDGDPNFDFQLRVCYNGELKLLCAKKLKTSGTCNAQNFYLKKKGTEIDERIDVYLCNYNGKDGVIRILTSSNLSAEINDMKLVYTKINESVQLETKTNISLNPKIGGVKIEDKLLVLGEEDYYKSSDYPSCGGVLTTDTCDEQCTLLGYDIGTCRNNPTQCSSNGETHESSGDPLCTEGPTLDTCCCGTL